MFQEDIIVEDIFFTFDKDNVYYTVHAYTYDKRESDEYTVEVKGYEDSGRILLDTCYYCDSCGGLTDDATAVASDSILTLVHNFLFNERKQSIVKGF